MTDCQFCGKPATKLRYKPTKDYPLAYGLCDKCAKDHQQAVGELTPKKQEPEYQYIDASKYTLLGYILQIIDYAHKHPFTEGLATEAHGVILENYRLKREKQCSTLLSQIRKHIEENLSDNTYDFGEYYGVALDHVLDYLTQLEGEQ